ncbi:long-chain fatty acid transport protein 4-like [Uloborus diversus]|uniref:long-chain fatty acid transport protein 4-like n=1 Tax=Uloborus diversus TaxID=327109 RepID=UPI002409B98C|nr:long-chain fatty acid transport protein 4-like [Uloborus diversus]
MACSPSNVASFLLVLVVLLLLVVCLSAAAFIFVASAELPPFSVIRKTIGRDIRAAYLYFRLLVFLRRCHAQNLSLVDLFKRTVQKYGSSVCFVYQDEEWTYNKVDELSNRVANLFLSRGYRKGDEVALFLENCPEYVCIWMGLAKIGVITSFINTNLRQDPLAHTINVIDARAIIFSRNLADAVKDAITFLKRKDTMDYYCFNARSSATSDVMAKNLDTLLEESSTSEEPLRNIKINFEDKLLYIYTSGTTGLPKAAIIRHSSLTMR